SRRRTGLPDCRRQRTVVAPGTRPTIRLHPLQRPGPRASAPGPVRSGLGYQHHRPRPAELPAMTLRTLFAALLLGLCLPLQAATEAIPLNYRTADDVLGVVQSMLGSEGKVSAYGNKLIVN